MAELLQVMRRILSLTNEVNEFFDKLCEFRAVKGSAEETKITCFYFIK